MSSATILNKNNMHDLLITLPVKNKRNREQQFTKVRNNYKNYNACKEPFHNSFSGANGLEKNIFI